MDSNLDSSRLNQEVGNRLTPEILLSSSEDSSSYGNDRLDSNDNKGCKSVTEYVNGINEDESRSCERIYLNEADSEEYGSQLHRVEGSSKKPSNMLDVGNVPNENKNSLCNQNSISENENSISEIIGLRKHRNILENMASDNENSMSEHNEASERENSISEHITINEKENSLPEYEHMEVSKNRGNTSKQVDVSKATNSISEINLCEDDSNLSEHNEKQENVSVTKDRAEKNVAISQKSSLVIDGAENSIGNDDTSTAGLDDSSMDIDKACDDDSTDLTEKRICSDGDKEMSSDTILELSQEDDLVSKRKSAELVETSFHPDEAKEPDKEIDEEQEVDQESCTSVPKIDLVTTLDVSIESNTGSPNPSIDSPAVNPLETDQDDTNDNENFSGRDDNNGSKNADSNDISVNENTNDGNQITIDDNDSTSDFNSDVTTPHLEPGNKTSNNVKVCNKDTSKSGKDSCEQEEVITGDKTVSHEYVTKNLELLGSDGSSVALNDHGYSKQGTPIEGKEVKSKKSQKSLKVIYPKRKVVDVTQLDIHIMPVPVLKHCLHCAKLAKCCIQIEVGGCECHLCSEDCLEQHKTLQSNTLRRSSIQPESQEDLADTRLCVQCNADVSMQSVEKILSWETMEFCNEDCLGKYQSKMWTSCTGCSKDVPTSSMGKYCVRFGHEVKQFCCSSCLEDFKKGIKACSYCQKDLSLGDEGFLAPIADKNQFRDFCSQNCLDEYDCMSRNLPAGGLKVESCGVCDKMQLVQVQVITTTNTVNLCSEVCFKAFKFVNKSICPAPCYMCKKYFENNSSNKVTVHYENELLSFCSKTCMNINILAKRRIVACNWCKVKKYNFDMIRRKTTNGVVTNWCSLNCMALYQVSMNARSLCSKSNCAHCFKFGFPSLHLSMSDGTIRNFCSLECVNKFQASFKNQAGNGVFPTGGPKRVVRTKTLVPANAEKNAVYTDLKDSSALMKSIPTLTAPAINQNKIDEPSVNVSLVGTTSSSVLTLAAFSSEVRNAKVQVYCHKVNKAVSVKPNRSTKSIQTDEVEEKGPVMVPIPVPIYIPVPMAMYSVPVPTPFPFPIPIPVPIVIPTTKGTAEEIFADIKKIQDKMPGNPYEAELLMMAEMAEGQKKSTDSDRINSVDASEETRLGQKRNCDEIDTGEGPPDKKRREDTRNNVLDNTVHHLATSRLSMSLKETLGVSAWKHYASQSGERLDLLEMRPGELAQALKRFIQDARIPGEGEYTPDQKYYLMLGIQYYLEESGRIDNIFSDKLFDPFIDALNEEAKKFQETFANSDSVITRVEEEHLWESKQLGPHTPSSLLATLIYFNTKYFNLTTVEEHMQLSFSHIMKHWKRNPNAVGAAPPPPSNNTKTSNGSRNVLLRFYPPQSSLDAPNSKKKKVYEQEENETDPYRCPVQIYEFYLSKCPESMKSRNDMFYLNPERSCVPDSPIWYSMLPLDPDVIERTLNRFRMVKEINVALLSDV